MSNKRSRPRHRKATDKILARLRKTKSPETLAAIDWLTTWTNQNPFKAQSTRWYRYEHAFARARRKFGRTTLHLMPTPRPRKLSHD